MSKFKLNENENISAIICKSTNKMSTSNLLQSTNLQEAASSTCLLKNSKPIARPS